MRGEEVRGDAVGELRVEVREARQAATQHDDMRIEDVDHVREAAREPARVPVEGRPRGQVSAFGARGDLGAGAALAGDAGVIGLQAGTRDPGLQAAATPAPAAGTGHLVRGRPRERVMAPLAADAEGAVDRVSTEYQPAATAGAEDDGEDRGCVGRRSIHRLRTGEAGCALGEAHATPETR